MYVAIQVKFITRPDKLNYYDAEKFPNTFCAYVLKGCNVPKSIDHEAWWYNVGRRATKEKIVALRNDRIKSMKWAFFGKVIVCCVC